MRDILLRDLVNRSALEFAIEEIENLDDLDDRLDGVAWKVAQEAKQFWSEEAGRMLDTTRLRYQRSLEIYENFEDGGVVVGLNPGDELVIAIEEGAPSFDMKPGLLQGAPRRVIPINPPKDMRTVVAGHGEDKWRHPGFKGLDLAGETDKQLDEIIIPKYLNELFDSL